MDKKGFIIIESLIYVVFMISDIMGYFDTTNLKYAGIILCFLYALFNKKRYGIIGFALTLEADYWLLVKDDKYPVGIIFFIFVQITYVFYLYKLNYRPLILLRILLPIVLLIIIKPNDLTTILALIYFPQLLISALYSFSNKKHRLLSIGLCLFVLCDVCVGLHNIYIRNVYVALGQWLFYLPSQVILALTLN